MNIKVLDVGKLKTVFEELNKLSDVMNNEFVKSTNFNTLKMEVNKLDKKISDTNTLIHISWYNTNKKIEEKNWRDAQKNITDITGLVITAVLKLSWLQYLTLLV